MQSNNILNIPRLALLFRQGFIHNYRMIAISIVAFSGGLFLLLMAFHLSADGGGFEKGNFSGIFIFVVIPLAIVYTGTAFPAFRNKEKSYSYLLIPASVFEKFLFEFFNRILLFLIVIPLSYWIIVNVEGRFISAIMPEYYYTPRKYTELLALLEETPRLATYAIGMFALLIFTIPFAGAASFTRLPVPKTLFIVAVIFFFNFFLGYLFVEVVGLQDYDLKPEDRSILFIKGEEGVFRALSIYGTVVNAGLLVVTYFKMREKEV